jgi:predicted GIY-YIG superfamily endonuclease
MEHRLFFIYFLRSQSNPAKTYIGYTNNIMRRLGEHNAGQSHYTSRYMPWELRAFAHADSEVIAQTVEAYFKNTSGQEKLARFREQNPEHTNPIEGYFSSLEVGKKFGRSTFQVKEAINGTVVFTQCPENAGQDADFS